MKRILLVLALAISCLPSAARAQENLIPDLTRVRATYPAKNLTPEQLGQFLNEVAWLKQQDGWGLLAKPDGNNCPTPAGVKVSCDYLMHKRTGQGFDVLSDSEGAAAVRWNSGGSFPADRWVAPVHPGTEHPTPVDPGGPPPPPAEAVPTIQQLQQQQILFLVRISQAIEQQAAQEAVYTAQLEQVIRTLQAELAKGIRVRF